MKNRISKNAKGEAFTKPYFVATNPLPYKVMKAKDNNHFELFILNVFTETHYD